MTILRKKLLAGALAVITALSGTLLGGTKYSAPLFSSTSISVSAADNGTGNYRVNTSAGLNIRSGPGTGNGILGAATNGTQFTVTKTQNGWGYGSVRCTNGTKNGWACLQYCTFLGRNEPSPETPLENGAAYWISPACATGSVIDISGVGYNDGANAHLWSKVGGTNQKNQQFKAVKRNNYYIFEAVHSGKALDVDGGYTGNGRNIHQWTTHGGNNQCWYLYSAGNGYYYIKSKMNTKFSLDVNGAGNANGTNIHLWESNTTNAQKFKFTKVTYVNNTTYTGYVSTSSQPLNLRSNASTSSSILASMPKGSTVTVLDNKNQTNGFYHVTYNGKKGYASAQYISFAAPPTPTPQPSSSNSIVNRANELYNLTWKPLKTIKGYGQNSTFYTGSSYRIPYGMPVNTGTFIGYNISVSNFIAQTKNANSKLYTSHSGWSGSGYGNAWYCPYYAMDCSTFVSYCWGLSSRQTTSGLKSYSNNLGYCNWSNIGKLQVGDALNSSGHVVLVTKISGDNIEITEETPPQLKRTTYTKSQLISKYSSYYIARKR